MTLDDSDRVELNELCSALVDGAADDAQRARLEDLLRGSEEARRFYVRAMQLSASLHSYAGEMQSEPANVVRPPQWRRWAAPLAAAALVMLGLWLAGVFERTADPANADDQDSVARVTGGKDCLWAGVAHSTGDDLASGERIELKSGVAEVTFDSGALLLVEGPALLDIRSAWEAELHRGTVRANVPQEAIGFRVTNPAVEIVDLGTEFSVTAGDGEAEVFVHKGAVEVHPRDAQGRRQAKSVLSENQARRFAKAGPGDVRDGSAERWQKLAGKIVVERLARPFTYARWSFDEAAGPAAAVEGSAKPFVIGSGAAWAPGKFGGALGFDGKFTARAELTGPLRKGVRTVAFWTRVPEHASDAGVFASVPANKFRLDLSWNRAPADGVVGALRFQALPGRVVGTSPLNNGRWQHIAAVFNVTPKNPGKQSVKLYVNGRLENLSGQRPFRAVAEKLAAEQDPALWLGGSPAGIERFVGQLDELVIADRQFTPQEIRHLMRTNALLSPEAFAGL
jgi:ferric-dicitrate binding protein FerR (iron transport regulator)